MQEPVIIGDATIYQGDVLDVLSALPSESVQMVCTSPPYWGLRDYKVDGMIGLEPTFQEYLDKMVAVFDEVKRVLRSDGTCWLNVGDAYAQKGGKMVDDKELETISKINRNNLDGGCGNWTGRGDRAANTAQGTLKPKDLIMMPARLAIALQDDGWWIRSEIIWAKPNPMPESVTDRPTSSHEKIYLMTKRARYFYDAEAVREKTDSISGWSKQRERGGNPKFGGNNAEDYENRTYSGNEYVENPSGRNLRNVWTIATQPYPGSHFATFPEELPRKCILAGTSDKGCCPACGSPWERVVESEIEHTQNIHNSKYDPDSGWAISGWKAGLKHTTTLGWQPTCTCNAGDPIPCTVLDIFGGAMTTALVAAQLNRKSISIELNPDYIKLGTKRITQEATQPKLF